MLDVLEDYLRLCGHPCERIDGSTSSRDRQAAIDRYSKGALGSRDVGGVVIACLCPLTITGSALPLTLLMTPTPPALACCCCRGQRGLCVPAVDAGGRAGHHPHRRRHLHHLRLGCEGVVVVPVRCGGDVYVVGEDEVGENLRSWGAEGAQLDMAVRCSARLNVDPTCGSNILSP